MFNVTFYTYSGMSIPVARGVEREEAKELVKERIRRARKHGIPVDKIDKGRWEFQTPDNAVMITDAHGILTVRKT